MEKHLLPQVPKYFKASLHTHSTISDGRLTPQQTRDAYREKGFSILALTDHSVCVSHQDLNLPDFLMITSVEIEVTDNNCPQGQTIGRSRHMCLLSKDPNRQWIPFRDPEPFASSVPYEAVNEIGNVPLEYSDEAFNNLIAECNRQGFLVAYNHPAWSPESYPDYINMKGLWAMEYRTSGGVGRGRDENNGQVYQDLLNKGNRLSPLCTDDMHVAVSSAGYPVLGGAWTMVGAPELTYDSVMGALERGDLYSSWGPEIHSLTWEDGILRITCSACRSIQVLTHARCAFVARSEACDLTHAEFDMTRWLKKVDGPTPAFFRLLVTAADGSYAVTRAYFPDEL